MRFSKIELRDLAICWIALGLCFSIGVLFNRLRDAFTTKLMDFFATSIIVLIAIGAGFILHELAHKAVSQRYGCWAEFRIWKLGFFISVATAVLSFGTFFFFAPGAVHTLSTRDLTKRGNGFISAAGPAANIVLAGVFMLLVATRYFVGSAGDFTLNFNIAGLTLKSHTFNIFEDLGWMGFQLNMWLAAFNLIPFGPLDGTAIFQWNKLAWGILAALSWGVFILAMFGVIKL